MYVTSIEKATCHQVCPQKRFLRYHALGNGIELIRRPIRDLTEELIRMGIAHLGALPAPRLDDICYMVGKEYFRQCATRGLEIEPGENPYDISLEQSALAQAVIRGFDEIRDEMGLACNYYMQDIAGHPVSLNGCDLTIGREDRWTGYSLGNGEGTIVRVRLVATLDSLKLDFDLHSMATIALPWMLQKYYNMPFSQKLVYVAVGSRRPDISGKKVQRSPWVRGYTNGMRIHWARNYKNKAGKQVRLGDEWKAFKTWVTSPECESLSDWIGFLKDQGALLPLFKVVTINPPTAEECERLRLELHGQEQFAEDAVNCLKKWTADAETKKRFTQVSFPMHRHSCDFPKPCEYQEVCYGAAAIDPIASLLYQKREEELCQPQQPLQSQNESSTTK